MMVWDNIMVVPSARGAIASPLERDAHQATARARDIIVSIGLGAAERPELE